ncbi:MAG: SMP-30/gluconolactonase/LRE family protein [Nitrospiraceae bacterium]
MNSLNDLVFKSNGDLYFTDPPFGLPKLFDDPDKDLRFQGVYRLSAGGTLTLLVQDINAPNGLAFSPDKRTLYITYITDVNPERPAWLAYAVMADGSLANGRVFFDASQWQTPHYDGPDGLKVDGDGNLFGARPGGISVFGPDGTHLGSIETGAATSNLAWGNDGSTPVYDGFLGRLSHQAQRERGGAGSFLPHLGTIRTRS